MLSISTSWWNKEVIDAAEWINQVKAVGVQQIELGYSLSKSQLNELLTVLPAAGVGVSSIHNFCPIPDDQPSPRHPSNHYRLSASDEDERRSAVHWTKRSVDLAQKSGAKIVVIHAGTLEDDDPRSTPLFTMYKEGKGNTSEFAALREGVLKDRRARVGVHVDAVEKSLKDLLPYAQAKNIGIGFETRYYPIEIPNHAEIGYFLGKFHAQGLGYWHDFGHAEVNSRLGITPHTRYLEDYAKYLIGCHIHGVGILRDHQAPFAGDFDPKPLLKYVRKEHVKVVECKSSVGFEEMKRGIEQLAKHI